MSIRELDEDDFAALPSRPLTGTIEPPARILARVCRQFSITMTELVGKDRTEHVARARQVAYWLLRQEGLGYSSIGRILGYRDHSTVLMGVRKVEDRCVREPALRQALQAMRGAW